MKNKQLCKRRTVDKKKQTSAKTKHNEWICFTTNVHSVSKLSRDQRSLVEECLQKHNYAKAEEIIICGLTQSVHQSLLPY